jgi:uncharacterized membrane protein
MENKNVGWLILGIAAVMVSVVLIFNFGLKKIVDESCSHGPTCTMYDTIRTQTWISVVLIGIIVIIGLFIMFSKPNERVVLRTIKEKKKKLDLSGLEKDERKVMEVLLNEGNAIFQADLMEKLEIGKVKMTRVLDKLEAKQFIERKRRGMNNIVVLKD